MWCALPMAALVIHRDIRPFEKFFHLIVRRMQGKNEINSILNSTLFNLSMHGSF
jgi:hypothetical protein